MNTGKRSEPKTSCPFCGSGTTGVVARRLGLRFLGLELSPKYCALAERRIRKALRAERQVQGADDTPLYVGLEE